MSILDEEEFRKLRGFRGKVSSAELNSILEEVEEDFARSGSLKSSLIFVYANHIEQVRKNKELYDLISAILEKYAPKIGLENVAQLILNSLS
ncbi:MAG: hypothetical protein K1T65_01620 [Candidatus Aramenus sp.]|nr:hypothetical protein [Candidatus Aramenus sp.]